jgi:DNA invertase Pin-like site-specific DNA recombinase
LTLRDSGVRFLAADIPEANDLTIGIMAQVAGQERQAISRRTKEALAVARARGVRLGNPNGAAALRRAGKGGVALQAAVRANAERFAADLAPVVADIRPAGHVSLRAIAAELNGGDAHSAGELVVGGESGESVREGVHVRSCTPSHPTFALSLNARQA